MRITSKSNEKIQHLRKLSADRRYRHACREYLIEGVRALEDSGRVKELFLRDGVPPPNVAAERTYVLSAPLFSALAFTENSQGSVGIAALEMRDAAALQTDGRYVLLDRLQDPGNMGTIIRTACAFGFDGIIVTPGCVDPYSPKAVRAAASSITRIPLFAVDSVESLRPHPLIAADMQGDNLSSFRWPLQFVLAIGNEANGLSDEVRQAAALRVAVGMPGAMESLNAAVSAGIILYAAAAQRDK